MPSRFMKRGALVRSRQPARKKNRNKFKKEDEESGRVVAHLYALNLPPAQLRVAELEQQRLELGHLGADGVVHQPNRVELRGQPPRPVLIRGKREHISGAIGVKVERKRGLRVEPRQAAGQPAHLRGDRVRVVRVLAPHGVIPERRTAVTVHGCASEFERNGPTPLSYWLCRKISKSTYRFVFPLTILTICPYTKRVTP